LTSRVRRVTGQQLRTTHGLDERAIGRGHRCHRRIGGPGAAHPRWLADELRGRGIAGSGQMLMICWPAELGGLICSGQSPTASTPTRS
jgi:hypothetical protein